MTDDTRNDRHHDRMLRKKAVVDQRIAEATTRKGVLLVNTGIGKGKSSAAFGVVARALGSGMNVAVIQFVKNRSDTGEEAFFRRCSDVRWHVMGEGFTWETQDKARDIAAAERAFAKAKELMADPAIRLLVLDELNIALRYEHLPLHDVVAALAARRPDLTVVVTGRNAKPELLAIADLVTEMTLVKHPFEQGIKAQRGIDF